MTLLYVFLIIKRIQGDGTFIGHNGPLTKKERNERIKITQIPLIQLFSTIILIDLFPEKDINEFPIEDFFQKHLKFISWLMIEEIQLKFLM